MKTTQQKSAAVIAAKSTGRIIAAEVITGCSDCQAKRHQNHGWKSFNELLQAAIRESWEPQGGAFVTPESNSNIQEFHVLVVKREGGAA